MNILEHDSEHGSEHDCEHGSECGRTSLNPSTWEVEEKDLKLIANQGYSVVKTGQVCVRHCYRLFRDTGQVKASLHVTIST